ncbi:hypothetical protein L6164_033821 [Bauhinia variegata]|uniref:Uncharacterized protein n=1 Tax=Bauhinia variegata TaxID=167791 RepID=A0ACB9KT31_BAUVA|nr:hypothetical protein L6164_033821 [Bauhinia variegata]
MPMESEKRRASSPSSSPPWPQRLGGDTDRLVKTEIEAAETLVDLAQLAMSHASSYTGDKCWKKGKRGRRPFARESPTPDSPFNVLSSPSTCPDLSAGQAVVGSQLHQKVCLSKSIDPEMVRQDVCEKQVKVEQDADLPKTSTSSTTNYASVGCNKPRRNLTEEEKEARRIRRVLANRESARQTIRRRQALCEELTRKAANLALENENLKRERELALKEYQSLETTNKQLKEQVAKSINTETEKTPVQRESPVVEMTNSLPTNSPWFLYNHFPVTQFIWPPMIQSSHPVQLHHRPHSSVVIPSNVSLPCSSESDSCHEQKVNDNQTQNPLYMLPCPWFFPLPEFGNGQHPASIGQKDKHDGRPVDKQYSTSSSLNTTADVDNHTALPIKLKTETSSFVEARHSNEPNDDSPRFSSDRGEEKTGSHIFERFHRPSSFSYVGHTSTIKCENGDQSHSSPNDKVSSTASHIASSLLEKKQKHVICTGKNLVDAVAAAEARKRRKALTKLKSTHGRQCRMHR